MVPFTTFFGHGFLDAFLVPIWLSFDTVWALDATLLASIGFLLVSFCIRFDSLRLLLELWASLYPPWSCILSAFPTSVAPSCTKMGFGAHSFAKQLQSTARFSHTWCFCRARRSYDTKFPQNLPCGSQLRKAPGLNRQKPPSKELLLCRTPHPPGPLRNFAAGNLDPHRAFWHLSACGAFAVMFVSVY